MLNEELAEKQGLTPQERAMLIDLHSDLLDVQNNPENYKDPVGLIEKIEFLMQNLWHFDEDSNYHTHWMGIKGCTCPDMDNRERVGSGAFVISTICPWHGKNEKEEGVDEPFALDLWKRATGVYAISTYQLKNAPKDGDFFDYWQNSDDYTVYRHRDNISLQLQPSGMLWICQAQDFEPFGDWVCQNKQAEATKSVDYDEVRPEDRSVRTPLDEKRLYARVTELENTIKGIWTHIQALQQRTAPFELVGGTTFDPTLSEEVFKREYLGNFEPKCLLDGLSPHEAQGIACNCPKHNSQS